MPHTYWRFLITACTSSGAPSAAEIELRATSGGADQCSGGTASASSFYPSGGPYGAAQAFDNNNTTFWASLPAGLPEWVQYQFASPVDVLEYTLRMRPDGEASSQGWRDWQLQYSDNGSTWTQRDSRVSIASWTAGEQRTFTLTPLAPAAQPHMQVVA